MQLISPRYPITLVSLHSPTLDTLPLSFIFFHEMTTSATDKSTYYGSGFFKSHMPTKCKFMGLFNRKPAQKLSL